MRYLGLNYKVLHIDSCMRSHQGGHSDGITFIFGAVVFFHLTKVFSTQIENVRWLPLQCKLCEEVHTSAQSGQC